MKAIEWNAFDQSNACDELGIAIIHVAPVADGKRIVNGEMKAMNVISN